MLSVGLFIDKLIFVVIISLRNQINILSQFYLAGIRTSGPNKSDTTSDPRPNNLHPAIARNNNGRSAALRLHLYSTVFHLEFVVVFTNVLYVRVPILSFHYSCNYLLWDDNTSLLFPFMCRGLPLVVALVSHFRFHSRISFLLLLSLFRYKAFHWRCRVHILIFRLYAYYGVLI